MADDNILLNAGTGGKTIRTDDDETAHWQYVKLAYGADNTQNIVTSISVNPLPVALSATDSAVLDVIAGDTTAIQTAVEIMDDWDESDRAKVNPIAGQAGIAANAGAMSALTTRVTVATDDTHFGTVGAASDIDGVIHGQLRYIADQLVTIDSDTDAIKTAVETLDNAISGAGFNITQFAGAGVPIGAGTEAAALRVTLATDSTGTLTVDTTGTSGLEVVQVTAADLNMTEASAADIKTAVEAVAGAVQAEDSAHASTDTGFMSLGVRIDAPTEHAADGDYAPMTISEHGCVNVDAQHFATLDDCDSTSGWTVLNNDTDNLTTSTNHVWKTKSLSFDKVNGAGDTVYCGIQRAITSISLNGFIEEGGGFLLGSMYFSSLANVAYAWFRAGTNNGGTSANYNEWRISVDDLTAGRWNALRGVMRAPYTTAGDGWSSAAVDWMAIGVAFDSQTNTLAEILVDGLFANSGLQTSSDITSQVSSSVSSPNVNVKKWGSTNVSADEGTHDSGTLRITQATDDDGVAHLATIAGAVSTQMQVDVVAALPAGTNAIGKLAANSGVDIGDVDVTSVVPGTAATNLGKARASALGATDTGVAPLAVRNDDLDDLSGADGDYTPLQVNSEGALFVNQSTSEFKQASGVAAGGTPGADDMVAAVGSRYLIIHALALFATSATTNTIYVDNVDNMLIGNASNGIALSIDADGDTVAGFVLPFNPGGWAKTDAVNEAITLNTSAAQDIIYCITYSEVD